MAEWQQLLQSIFLGLIFSYLLAKLISIVTSFRDENLTVTRNTATTTTAPTTSSKKNLQIPIPTDARLEATMAAKKSPIHSGPVSPAPHEADSVVAEQGSMAGGSSVGGDDDYDDDDDDWEGVESTELDEAFSAATAFIATSAADRLSQKIPNDVQLQLYGLYKIATEGPCNAPQPSALKITARAKWQAWQKLGAMPPEDAMQKYIDIVTELYPSWLSGSSMNKAGEASSRGTDVKGPAGPVFSSFIYEEDSGNDLKMDAVHVFAREGDTVNLLKCIESAASVNSKDSEGRTPLHWAVDRGQLNVVELLVSKNADVNIKDNDGQTPLHYAVVCEREAIADYLVKHNANVNLKDNDGNSPCDLCESNWSWMQQMRKQEH